MRPFGLKARLFGVAVAIGFGLGLLLFGDWRVAAVDGLLLGAIVGLRT